MTGEEFVQLKRNDLVLLNKEELERIAEDLQAMLRIDPATPIHVYLDGKELLCIVTSEPTGRTGMAQVILRAILSTNEHARVTLQPHSRDIVTDHVGRGLWVRAEGVKSRVGAEDASRPKDSIAILDPYGFLQRECQWKWLPQHDGTTISARDRLTARSGDPEKISPTAMLVLLDYRRRVCDWLMRQTREAALEYSRTKLLTGGTWCPTENRPRLVEFAAGVKRLGGNAPGSLELTSDIDINTYGDGTEFGVRHFNSLFRDLFGGIEPGTVFDVNIYAKDFLPSFPTVRDPGGPERDPWIRRRVPPEGGEYEDLRSIRPAFDHEFTVLNLETVDAGYQLEYGFVKLRRYMIKLGNVAEGGTRAYAERRDVERSWNEFLELTPERFKTRASWGRISHLNWNAALYCDLVSLKSDWGLRSFHRNEERLEGEALVFEENLAKYPDRAALMRVQNRNYEFLLKTEVEDRRSKLSFLKFTAPPDSASRDQRVGHNRKLDEAYFELRLAMSKSLYFANEAYITAGGVLQVVGGKQMKSRKVSADYRTKTKFHNIAYTAHELMQSAVDQLADIHKEGRRHLHAHPNDVGGCLIGAGKYIHRLFNAVKHLYQIFGRIRIDDHRFLRSYPAIAFESPDEWTWVRRFGFGLEGLKKADLNEWPSTEEVAEERLAASWERWRNGNAGMLRFLLADKLNLRRDEVRGLVSFFAEPPRVPTKEAVVLWVAGTLNVRINASLSASAERINFPLTPSGGSHIGSESYSEWAFFRFFDLLVLRALTDYARYLELPEGILQGSTGRDHPPYIFEIRPITPLLRAAKLPADFYDDDLDDTDDLEDLEGIGG